MSGLSPSPTPVVFQSTAETATSVITQLLGLAVLAGTLAAVTALAYRWYTRERVSRSLALVVGLAGVAVYLNASTALGQTLLTNVTPTEEALLNMVAFLFGTGGALAGRRAGDRFGTDVVLQRSDHDIEEDVGTLVRTVGQVTVVELPEEIADVVGYDPVPEATREALSGKRFVFPRDLTVSALRDRLVARIKEDYAVGHVDLELGADGSVDHLALGSRAAGIGPTLPPATNAVAVRADPAFSANAGDLVQVWETDPMRRVLTGELRGVAGDVVTIAIDASDTPKVDPTREYRLVTLPVDDRPEREFASLLRAAPETFSSVTVEAGSPLHGMPVGALDTSVVAVTPEGAEPDPLPAPSTLLAPGDTVFAIAAPEALRRLETASEPLDPALVRDVGRPSVGTTDEPIGAATTSGAEEETAETMDTGEATTGTDEAPADATSADAPQAVDDSVVAGADDAVPGDDGGAPGGDPLAAGDDGGLGGSDSDIADADGSATDTASAASTDDGDDSATAGTSSFDELKAEFESGEADWDEDDSEPVTDDEPASPPAEADGEPDSVSAGADDGSGAEDSASASSFQELKDEFESGEADWDETEATSEAGKAGDETATEDLDDLDLSEETDSETAAEDLDGLDLGESDGSGEDDDDGLSLDDDSDDGLGSDDGGEADDLSELTFDEDDEADDLSELTFDEDDDEDLFGDDSAGETGDADLEDADDSDEGSDDSADENADDDDDDSANDDDDGGGGGTSFQQLKEEFESGEADWEDEISDSPGGDMRLDE